MHVAPRLRRTPLGQAGVPRIGKPHRWPRAVAVACSARAARFVTAGLAGLGRQGTRSAQLGSAIEKSALVRTRAQPNALRDRRGGQLAIAAMASQYGFGAVVARRTSPPVLAAPPYEQRRLQAARCSGQPVRASQGRALAPRSSRAVAPLVRRLRLRLRLRLRRRRRLPAPTDITAAARGALSKAGLG